MTSVKVEVCTIAGSSASDLVTKLNQCRGFSVGWRIQAGQHLREFRSNSPEAWKAALASGTLPLCERSAQTLMRIAETPAFWIKEHLQHLPDSIAALDVLAVLDAGVLKQAIEDGTIHPRLTTKAAKEIVGRHRRNQALATGHTSAPIAQ